eukprot:m.40614 g.40614  ORF g.40614 m.40614 type:complete len:76 (-) comp6936_c0_seq1:173-400(-)
MVILPIAEDDALIFFCNQALFMHTESVVSILVPSLHSMNTRLAFNIVVCILFNFGKLQSTTLLIYSLQYYCRQQQ